MKITKEGGNLPGGEDSDATARILGGKKENFQNRKTGRGEKTRALSACRERGEGLHICISQGGRKHNEGPKG